MSAAGSTLRPALERTRRIAWSAALLLALASAFGAWRDPPQLFRSYLLGYLFVISVPLGSLALVMLHSLTGGSWGFAVRRLLEAATRTLPVCALFFLPIALGARHIYEWTRADLVAADPVLSHKQAYLDEGAFRLRAAACFAVWCGLALALNRLSARMDRDPDPRHLRRLRAIAAPGLFLYVLATTCAAVDWAMSLEPHWYSTIYGLAFVVGHVLATLSFAIVVSSRLARHAPFDRWISPDHFHDLGKLLFAFVMLWAYVAYSQYLIVWSGDVAEETPWYLHRTHGGWQAVALALIALHFALPFALLLSRRAKRNARVLAAVALGLLAARFLDLAWLIVPAFHHDGLHVEWMDLSVPAALFAGWLGLFVGRLVGRPLISLQDARLERELEVGARAPEHG